LDELTYFPGAALAAAIRERKVSSLEVIEAHLVRIQAVNPLINAVVQLSMETVRAEARAADIAVTRGEPLGPLHGVPFTVKDVVETAGVVCAAGLPERSTFVPERDAVVVSRLRAAGGIMLAKTNVPPGGGTLESDNPVYGRTNNPYDLARTPGEAVVARRQSLPQEVRRSVLVATQEVAFVCRRTTAASQASRQRSVECPQPAPATPWRFRSSRAATGGMRQSSPCQLATH